MPDGVTTQDAASPAAPPRRSPLASYWSPGDYGDVAFSGPGVTLARRETLSAIQIDARPGQSEAVGKAFREAHAVDLPSAGQASEGEGVRALWFGPDRWLILAKEGGGLETRLRSTLDPAGGVVIDQTNGRAILRLSGPNARDLLAKGTGVDLHNSVFSEDAVTMTSYGHFSILLDRRRGPVTFDIHVMRGFAVSMFEELCENAAEFGYRLV